MSLFVEQELLILISKLMLISKTKKSHRAKFAYFSRSFLSVSNNKNKVIEPTSSNCRKGKNFGYFALLRTVWGGMLGSLGGHAGQFEGGKFLFGCGRSQDLPLVADLLARLGYDLDRNVSDSLTPIEIARLPNSLLF